MQGQASGNRNQKLAKCKWWLSSQWRQSSQTQQARPRDKNATQRSQESSLNPQFDKSNQSATKAVVQLKHFGNYKAQEHVNQNKEIKQTALPKWMQDTTQLDVGGSRGGCTWPKEC